MRRNPVSSAPEATTVLPVEATRQMEVFSLSGREPLSLIVQAARMYHEQGMSQPEIAKKLSVSQSRISRWLKAAEERGIIRTIVLAPDGVYPELEEGVRDLFSLRHVVVADAADDEQAIMAALGSAAAIYLETTLADAARVGISSYSGSLMATVDAMLPLKKRQVDEIVQVMGGIGKSDVQMRATQVADRLARLTGATPRFLPTPGLVSSVPARDALFADPIVQDIAKEWGRLTDVLVGIGSISPSELLRSSGNSISESEMNELRRHGAVGDVAMRFFDDSGELVQSELNDRVIGIGVNELRRVPRRVGIAGGSRKFHAIRAALRGGWVDVLITDQTTARRLLSDRAPAEKSTTPTSTPRNLK